MWGSCSTAPWMGTSKSSLNNWAPSGYQMPKSPAYVAECHDGPLRISLLRRANVVHGTQRATQSWPRRVAWLRAAVRKERRHTVEFGEAGEDGQHQGGAERCDPQCRTGGTLPPDATSTSALAAPLVPSAADNRTQPSAIATEPRRYDDQPLLPFPFLFGALNTRPRHEAGADRQRRTIDFRIAASLMLQPVRPCARIRLRRQTSPPPPPPPPPLGACTILLTE